MKKINRKQLRQLIAESTGLSMNNQGYVNKIADRFLKAGEDNEFLKSTYEIAVALDQAVPDMLGILTLDDGTLIDMVVTPALSHALSQRIPRVISKPFPGDPSMQQIEYVFRSAINKDFDGRAKFNYLSEGNTNAVRKALRRMILKEMAEITAGAPAEKVVELSLGSAFFLRHPELEGGEIVIDEMDEVAGALVALKGMGFTHVFSSESEVTEPIGATIQYFDEGDFLYTDHYGDVSHDALVDDMDMDFGGLYDEDSEDDEWI